MQNYEDVLREIKATDTLGLPLFGGYELEFKQHKVEMVGESYQHRFGLPTPLWQTPMAVQYILALKK